MLNWRHSRVQFIIRRHPTSLNRRRSPSLSIAGQIFELEASHPHDRPPASPRLLPSYKRTRPTPNSAVFDGAISDGNRVFGDRLSMRRYYAIAAKSMVGKKNVMNFKRAVFVNDRDTRTMLPRFIRNIVYASRTLISMIV